MSRLPYMLKGSTQGVTLMPGRTLVPRETLPIITVPINFTKKMERKQAALLRKIDEKKLLKERLKRREVLISCTNMSRNLYRGQHYGKFEQVPLACQGWKKRTSVGDHFVINRFGDNPAYDTDNQTFEELGLRPDVVAAIGRLGYEQPTNIQVSAIPTILRGRNTLISAETGNGKTLAFLAPLLQKVWEHKRSGSRGGEEEDDKLPFNAPSVLVVAPGRELAEQVQGVCDKLAVPLSLHTELLLGSDRTKLKMIQPRISKPDVVVATLGVLSKLVTSGVLKTSHVRHIVLDEADTLLDDSFNSKMKHFLRRIPISSGEDASGVQLVLAGATLPRSLDSILEGVLEPSSLERVTTPTLHHILPHVTQRFFRLSTTKKVEKILDIAKDANKKKRPTIIFSNSYKTVDWLGIILRENEIDCIYINGNRKDSVGRSDLYKQFIAGESYVLSCTDLVSRGLDTFMAQHVVNYDFPKFMSDYIHRCGRVGRAGSACNVPLVTSFVRKPSEVELLQQIEYAVRRQMELPNVNANIKRLYAAEKKKIEKEQVFKEQQRNIRAQARIVEKGVRKTIADERINREEEEFNINVQRSLPGP